MFYCWSLQRFVLRQTASGKEISNPLEDSISKFNLLVSDIFLLKHKKKNLTEGDTNIRVKCKR